MKSQEELSDYNFVDSSKVIWNLRKIKSKIEIEYISKVCSIASKVFDNFPDKIYPKINEREATSIFKKELINNGVDYIMYMACASGQGGYDQIISNPTEKQLNNGDILIYPIPSSKVLHIQTTDGDRLLEAKIYTTNGKLIKKCITQPIAISNLNSGMYFIEIKTLKIDKLQKKIVVNQQ